VAAGIGGLPQDSVALCHQIRVLDKQGLADRIGSLPPSVMDQIERVVRVTLGL
jgi:mRNA interferase MazF